MLLVAAAAIWGFATVVIKDVVTSISPFWLVGMRMLSAGLVLAIVFAPRLLRARRNSKLADHVRVGAIIGLFSAAGYLLNTYALLFTTAAKSSFLTSTYVVLTPFLAWMWIKRRPRANNIVAALVCLCGIACITLNAVQANPFAMGWGDAVTLVSAIMFGFEVTAGSVLAPKRDIGVITTVQFLVAGVVSIMVALAFEAPPHLEVLLAPKSVAQVCYLVLAGTCLTMLLQNKGLANVDASLGSLLLSTEAVFGAVFAVIVLGEALTVPMIVGFALVFASLLISEGAPLLGIVKYNN